MKRVLFTGFHFDGWHGSMLHICEIAQYLTEQGYECFCASVSISENIKAYVQLRGLKLFHILDVPLEYDYDIVWAYHFPILATLLEKGLKYQKIHLGCLSSFCPIEFLPPYYKDCALTTVISQEAKDVLVSNYHFEEEYLKVVPNLLPNSFCEASEYVFLHEELSKVAVVSNHIPKELRELSDYLENIQIDYYGVETAHYTPITPDILAEYDCVISIGKTIIYALGMGITAFEYDKFGGCGYITPENYALEEYYNYSGRGSGERQSAQLLAHNILTGYKRACLNAQKMQFIAKERYLLSHQVSEILALIEKAPQTVISPLKYNLFYAHAQSFIEYASNYLNQIGMLDVAKKEQQENLILLENNIEVLKKEVERLSDLTVFSVWKKIRYPKILIRLISFFIFKAKNRKHFYLKYAIED